MFKILLLISVGVVISNAFVCTENYCDGVCCKPVECTEDEIFVKKGSTCGCCDVCRTILYEGESCPPLLSGGPPPTSQCEEGTTCQNTDDGRVCVRNCGS
ncbi:uncharacterized protein NPIL_646931 [Nephila pilipes]|uniref:Venom protein n=1 Tax=Nephila pilipes TaxID=299642 RepID=A0A8X6TE46_NEPPI|nr:uncharacterized protein NPIL_646931 [Nephila pilipes]